MELVKEKRKPLHKNPKMQIIYSVPKAGKTTIIAGLPNHLILELEPGGADYVEARVQQINKVSEFNDVLKAIRESPEKVCDYLIVDTITRLDDWSELAGTYNFMQKPQGKKFNREGEKTDGKMIYHTDVRFETVHSLGQGYGYQHSRQVMIDWYNELQELLTLGKATYIILVAHVKDKLVESRNGDSVETIDLNLTGKVKAIYASKVDAVGHFYRENGKGYISYDNEHKVVCGGRCPHLNGSIQVSEKLSDGAVNVNWENIYLK